MTPQGYDDYKNVLTIPMNSALWIGNALVFKRETIKKSRAAVSSERNQFKKKILLGDVLIRKVCSFYTSRQDTYFFKNFIFLILSILALSVKRNYKKLRHIKKQQKHIHVTSQEQGFL